MKILVCDYTGISQQWLEQFTFIKNYEVVGTLTPASDKNLMLEKNWDYLLIFEQGARQFFNTMLKFMNIAAERVIFAMDISSWLEKPAAVFGIVNPQTGGGMIYRHLLFELGRQLNYFMTCTTADGVHYINNSNDLEIIRNMYTYRRNWAEGEMKIFHDLAQKYYQVDDSAGLFLDLGANIGTTGIYFLKKLTPNLKLLAFEPDAENFKMLRANLILNDIEEKAAVENFGLGIEESEQTLYRNGENPGANSVFAEWFGENNNLPTETIKIISLDKYFAEKNLAADDIKYIWIDTEGFEPQVLIGAQNILKKNPAPIFMEFNPHIYQKFGFYEKWMSLLSEIYGGYIFIQDAMKTGNFQEQPLEKLWEYQNYPNQVGDIFLIKKS